MKAHSEKIAALRIVSIFLFFVFLFLTRLQNAEAGINVWTTDGPAGGPIPYNTLAINPQTPTTVYAGAENGVYKSTDSGQTWTKAGALNEPITILVIDPQTPTTLYAVNFRDGIFKSTDEGRHWTSINSGLAHDSGNPIVYEVNALVVDPQIPSILYASIKNQGIFKTTDGGAAWESMNNGIPSPSNDADYIETLAIDPQTPTTLYAAVSLSIGSGVYKSTNGGAVWSAVSTGLGSVSSFAIDPKTTTILYAATNSGIFKSINGGGSWTAINTGPGNGILSLAVDPQKPTTVYATIGYDYNNSSVSKSTDGGGTWSPVLSGSPNFVAIDPRTTTTLYAASATGVLKSTDGGGSWTQVEQQLSNAKVSSLAIDPQTPTTIYAGTDGGVFKSTNRGSNWSAINTGLTNLTVNALAIDPQTPATLYAGSYGNGVYKSIDSGQTWTSANTGIGTSPYRYIFDFAINPKTPATLYAGMVALSGYGYMGDPGAVFKSTDGAESWSSVLTDDVRAMIIDPQSPTTLYAGVAYAGDYTRGGIYKTTDGGATWSTLNIDLRYPSPEFLGDVWTWEVLALVINPKNTAVIYAGTSGGGVFKSSDGGGTWSTANTGLYNLGINALAVDPQTPTTLYAGTSSSYNVSGTVYKSTDGGGTWSVLNAGLPTNCCPAGALYFDVYSLAVDPQRPWIIYAGTSAGLYSIEQHQNQPPSAVGVAPMNSTTAVNAVQILTAVYTDPDGWQNIAVANLYLAGNGGMHNEWLHYIVAPNRFTLMGSNDSCSPGQAKTISSGSLTLDCGASSISGSGTTLSVIYHVTPSSGMQYRMFSAASDQGGAAASAIFGGTWNVQ